VSKSGVWMPLYLGDYLADTMHLSGPDHGAYLLLLMHSWRNGPLPDDDRKLAAIARTDIKAWRAGIGETVRAFFTVTGAGLVQGRLERERVLAAEHAERRQGAARKAASARWQSDSEGNAQRNASRMPDALPDECPTPSPSQKKEHPSQPSVGRSPRGSRLPPEWSPDAEMRAFAEGLGLDADRVAANFRDYWHAKAGKDAVKLDWPATWRGWCRREAERGQGRGVTAARPRDDAHARRSAAFDQLAMLEGLKL
jgi:uncharacterized protein YdaU (DUF1376 family)